MAPHLEGLKNTIDEINRGAFSEKDKQQRVRVVVERYLTQHGSLSQESLVILPADLTTLFTAPLPQARTRTLFTPRPTASEKETFWVRLLWQIVAQETFIGRDLSLDAKKGPLQLIRRCFKKIPHYRDSYRYLESWVEREQSSEQTHYSVIYLQQVLFALRINPYYSAERVLEAVDNPDHPVHPDFPIEDIVNSIRVDTNLLFSPQDLTTVYGMVNYRKIAGDGDCFFRSIMMGLLEQIIVMPNEDRARWFTTLADRLDTLLQSQSLDAMIHEESQVHHREMIGQFVANLRRAANRQGWLSPQEFDRDLLLTTLDRSMVVACRCLAAQYLYDHRQDNYGVPGADGGLTLSAAIAHDYQGNICAYGRDILTKLKVYSDAIEPFLFESLGIDGQILGIDYDVKAQAWTLTRRDLRVVPDAELSMTLLLKGQHYTLLRSHDQVAALNEARALANDRLLRQAFPPPMMREVRVNSSPALPSRNAIPVQNKSSALEKPSAYFWTSVVFASIGLGALVVALLALGAFTGVAGYALLAASVAAALETTPLALLVTSSLVTGVGASGALVSFFSTKPAVSSEYSLLGLEPPAP